MLTVPLEFPVLVTPSKTGYHLRPLFLDYPYRRAKRFRDAVELLIKDVRRQFQKFETSRETIDELLWFAFNPKLKYETKKLCFSLGAYMIFGDFAIVRFFVNNHQVVFLPQFNNFFAIVSDNLFEYGSFTEQLNSIIYDRLQEERKNNPNNFTPNNYYAKGSEFVTNVSLEVNVKRAKFPFEEEINTWFASLSGQQEHFSGAIELSRVASNWRDFYPNRLQRATLRDEVVERLSKLIFGVNMTAVVLIGRPGSGRTTVLQEAFYRYLEAQENQSQSSSGTIWHLDPNRVIAGMSIVGMWQRRFESILEYLIKGRPKTLAKARPRLFVDNLVALFRIGKSAQNSLTLSDVLKPYLEQRALTFIAEASPEEWHVVMETDRRFADLCQVFRLDEVSLTDSARIALKERARFEQEHECEIDNDAIERIFALSHSLLRSTARPGNIVNFIERLAAKYRYAKVDSAAVEKAVSEMSHISADILDRQKTLSLDEVEKALSKQLIGQKEAIGSLVEVIQSIKAGLQDPNKPLSTLLFIGPTGVGKTQAAKVLTRYLFTDESQLIRLDMNEFVTDADVGRLIGNWARPDGLLTTQIRHQPFSVLLLDEIEKAHPAIHDLLLQVLGEGRLTDALGRTTDFTNTIIILTSNLGAEQAGRHLGFIKQDKKNQSSSYRAAVEDFFRPELLNRLDRIVVFKSLEQEDAIAITRLQLNDLLQRDGFVRRTTILNIDENALVNVTQQGFDAILGGRALKRAIERNLTTLAASQLVGLTATQPILLEIKWINERLEPCITGFSPVAQDKSVSALRQQNLNAQKIKDLLAKVCDFRERLYQLRDNAGDTVEQIATSNKMRLLLTLQESAFELKEELDDILWAIETARDPNEVRFIKTSQHFSLQFNWGYEQYINIAQMYAHQDIGDYLEEMYVIAPKLIREANNNWINLLMKITFLGLFCEEIEKEQYDSLYLTLRSRVHLCGKTELNYLQQAYHSAIEALGLESKCLPETKPSYRQLHIQGPGLHKLLMRERGIHLFHPANANAVPIQVTVCPAYHKLEENQLFNDNNEGGQTLPIIRNYVLSEKGGVMSDLRTGMLNRTMIGPHEWALLWYANLFDLVVE
jgi:ATP-dependent Clp protease ATP-binding subunit ClpC